MGPIRILAQPGPFKGRAPSPSHAVAVELQGQLLALERELDSRESVMVAWEERLTAFARALGEVRVERDARRVHADVI
jgi:hypothetical protein